MLDLGLSMKVELRTNTTAAKGLAWHDDEDVARCTACTPQPCGCDEQSHDGEIEIEKQTGWLRNEIWNPNAEDVGTAHAIRTSQTCGAS